MVDSGTWNLDQTNIFPDKCVPVISILQTIKCYGWWEFSKLVSLFIAQSWLFRQKKSWKLSLKTHPWKIDHRVDLFTLHLPIKYNVSYFLSCLIINFPSKWWCYYLSFYTVKGSFFPKRFMKIYTSLIFHQFFL